jgi:hypothetical protein
VEVNLYYQTTSREYIEFLRDEINGTGNLTLTDPGAGGGPAYIVQTDPFFAQLKAWGDTIWNLWTHNMNVDGAAPFLMTQATFGDPTVCGVSALALRERHHFPRHRPDQRRGALLWDGVATRATFTIQ